MDDGFVCFHAVARHVGSTIVLAMVILVMLTSLLRFIILCYSIFCTIFFIELVSFAAIFGQLENRYFHFSNLIYTYFIYIEYFIGLYIVSNGFFFFFWGRIFMSI